jgi:putative ABC transport system permease protein
VIHRVPLAWLQMRRERLRLVAAIAGVSFGVVLVFVQLGFQEALFDSALTFHTSLGYDIAIISPKTDTIIQADSFPRTRVFQALGVDGVESVTPVYMGNATWRNPTRSDESKTIFVFGVDPNDRAFEWDGVASQLEKLRQPDRMLFDRASRPEYGPVPLLLDESRQIATEVNGRRIEIVGLFEFGTSFGIDGSLFTSDLNFRRLFPDRPASHVDVGLIYLEQGADPVQVRDAIASVLPRDVEVFSREEFIAREFQYWNEGTPIGYVFSFGVIMGLVVGMVIVYQILFSDVQNSLREYATLKAMGYANRYLVGVVVRQSILLGVFGYVPALGVTWLLYEQAAEATNLPLVMTTTRAVIVLALTLGMCCASASLALRKLRSADPAEIF